MNGFKPQKNSWYISRHIKECHSLFSDVLDAFVEAFICRCGEKHIYITPQTMEEPYHICRACGNNGFLDANTYNLEHFSAKIDMKPTVTRNTSGNICVMFHYTIPFGIDLAADNVRYTTESIVSFEYKKDYIEMQHLCSMDESLEWLLKETAISLIMEELNYAKADIDSLMMRKKAFLLRFGKSPACMYHWSMDQIAYSALSPTMDDTPMTLLHRLRNNHHQRSLKRILFHRYKSEMAKHGQFDALTPYILFRTFTNVDLLQQVLKKISLSNFIIAEHERVLFHNTLYHYYVVVALDLLQKLKESYTQKAIAKLLLEASDNLSWWYDIIAMFYQIQKEEAYQTYLQLPKRLSVASLHDTLIKANNLIEHHNANHPFVYNQHFIDVCVIHNGLSFKLPKTPTTLIDWSHQLHNCLYGYIDHVRSKQSTIFGIFKQDTLSYALEIQDNAIVQCYGKYNKSVPDDVNWTIQKWFVNTILKYTTKGVQKT